MTPNDIPNAPGVYRIVCTVTGKLYIGSAIDLHKRCQQHRNDLRRNAHCNAKLQRAFNKYGEDAFVFEVLEFVLPIFLTAREQYWFNKLKPVFNIAPTAGSRLGTTHSPATRAKIGAKSVGRTHNLGRNHSPETKEILRMKALDRKQSAETIRKRTAGQKGRKRSPESCEKSRIGRLGKQMSPESCARISASKTKLTLIVIAPDGTEYLVYGLTKFCQEHSLHYSHMIEVAQGKSKHHKGWTARYPETGAS